MTVNEELYGVRVSFYPTKFALSWADSDYAYEYDKVAPIIMTESEFDSYIEIVWLPKSNIIWYYNSNVYKSPGTRIFAHDFIKWAEKNDLSLWPPFGQSWFGISPTGDGIIWTFELMQNEPYKLGNVAYRGPCMYPLKEMIPKNWIPLGEGALTR